MIRICSGAMNHLILSILFFENISMMKIGIYILICTHLKRNS